MIAEKARKEGVEHYIQGGPYSCLHEAGKTEPRSDDAETESFQSSAKPQKPQVCGNYRGITEQPKYISGTTKGGFATSDDD